MIEETIPMSSVGSSHQAHFKKRISLVKGTVDLQRKFFLTAMPEFFLIITAHKQNAVNTVHST